MATQWRLTGDYFENCNCDVACPCLFSAAAPLTSRPSQGACDVVLANDGVNFGNRCQARVPHGLGVCLAKRARQLTEARIGDHRHMRGGVTGVDHGAAIAFEYRKALARRGREIRRRQSDNATADDNDVNGEIAVEFRERR